jgi:peptidoglycan hydrolase CwlO-like protein
LESTGCERYGVVPFSIRRLLIFITVGRRLLGVRKRAVVLMIALFALLAPLFIGCSSAPPCTVSPIEIEETREDVKSLDASLEQAKERVRSLQDKLSEKQKEYETKKDKPADLKKKVGELEKGSGRG